MLHPKLFYFMRHGQTDWNVEQRLMGHQPIPLNAVGRNQALLTQKMLEKIAVSSIAYSPLLRTCETMELVSAQLVCNKIEHDALKERHWGSWEGKLKTDLMVNNMLSSQTPPDGETREQFFERVINGVNDILIAPSSGPVLIISHSGVYRVLCHYAGFDAHHVGLGNGSIVAFVPPTEATEGMWDIQLLR